MTIRSILLALVLLASLIFVPLNWEALNRSETVNLALGRVQAPLGLVLVVTLLSLCALYFLIAQFTESFALRQLVARDKQIKGLRDRLDGNATEVMSGIEQRIVARLETTVDERLSALGERVSLVRDELAADIGKAEDSLTRLMLPQGERVQSEGGRPLQP